MVCDDPTLGPVAQWRTVRWSLGAYRPTTCRPLLFSSCESLIRGIVSVNLSVVESVVRVVVLMNMFVRMCICSCQWNL
jgi:RNase P/RNase MRP subunit POP5